MIKLEAKSHVDFFVKGIQHAFNWNRVYHLVTTSKSVQQTLLKSIALNGVAYLGILILLQTFYNTPDHHLFGYSYTDLTGYPLYLICLVFNSKLYVKIANHQNQQQNMDIDLLTTMSTIILYGNFALFIAALRMMPLIGSVVSFFVYCIVMSYYCFEYKWINQDWTIEQRMIYAEEHWAYCLGFGLSATILTWFLSFLHSGAMFALIFPSYIIMASVATPEPSPPIPTSENGLPYRLPVFIGIRYMNQFMIQLIRTLSGSRGQALLSKNKDSLGKLV